jgi:hypothetical protein
MKKFMFCFLLLGVCLLWMGRAEGETQPVYVSGAVSGEWGEWGDNDSPSPDTSLIYIVRGKTWVPHGSSLKIGGGVRIHLECESSFDVFGSFVAKGVDSTGINPIEIRAIANSPGFWFWGSTEDTVLLDHVYFSEDSFPRAAFTSMGRTLKVTNCQIRALQDAIYCFGAPAEVSGCEIYKEGGGGAALTLKAGAYSRVERTSVKVDFMSMHPEFPRTAGIHVGNSPALHLSDITIEVNGPGQAAGIYGENRANGLSIDRVNISVGSSDLVSRGIWLVNAGHCDIGSSTVSVASQSSVQAAVWLHGRTVANIVDCDLRLDGHGQGELIHQEDGATVTVDGVPVQPDPRRPQRDAQTHCNGVWIGTAFPNPFNLTTTLPLELPLSATVNLRIIDILGRQVATIACGTLPAGQHNLSVVADTWASGSYYVYVMVDGKFTKSQRLILIK